MSSSLTKGLPMTTCSSPVSSLSSMPPLLRWFPGYDFSLPKGSGTHCDPCHPHPGTASGPEFTCGCFTAPPGGTRALTNADTSPGQLIVPGPRSSLARAHTALPAGGHGAAHSPCSPGPEPRPPPCQQEAWPQWSLQEWGGDSKEEAQGAELALSFHGNGHCAPHLWHLNNSNCLCPA